MIDRICPSLKNRVVSEAKASEAIKDGMTVAMSGYAMAGYPKAIPAELIRRKKEGQNLSINLITGANVPWLDENLGSAEIISRRVPMCANKVLSSQVNSHKVSYVEQQMCKMPRLLRNHYSGNIDVVIVEALAVTEEGIVPTTSVGLTKYLLEASKEIIVEINSAQPDILFGMHDVYIQKAPPSTEPIPLKSCTDRIGSTIIPFDVMKIKYLVETAIPENDVLPTTYSNESVKITENLLSFLRQEYDTANGGFLPPIQLGFGNIADTIADLMDTSEFNNIQYF
jgi:succinyl-CoA:acetate CoA-transferase